MSSILDALKKSERQRSLGRDLIFRNASHDAAPRLTGFAVAVLVTLLLLAVAIGALLFNLREPELPLPPAITPTEIPAPPTDSDANSTQERINPIPLPAPTVRMESVPAVDNKAQSSPQTAVVKKKPVTTKSTISVPAPRVPEQPLPATGTSAGETPWLSSLPASFRSSLPPLVVNIHVYSPDQSQRILYINNRPVQQGERIEGGVVVEEIVHDGVVLQYRGQRFRLPRPS